MYPSSLYITLPWYVIQIDPTSLPVKLLGELFSGGFCCMKDLAVRASLIAQLVKNLPAVQETLVQFLDREDPWEKG